VHTPALDHGALPGPLAGARQLLHRRLGRWLGWLLVALSFWFVGARLWQAAPWTLVRARLEPLLLVTMGSALVYGVAGFLLSAAWRQILSAEQPPGPAAGYHAIYGRSQIAKYLPGNCFHFAGRQVLGTALGHSQAALALASVVETALLTVLAAGLGLPLALTRLSAWSIALPAGALLVLALALAAPRLLTARLWPPAVDQAVHGLSIGVLLRAASLHGTFFGIAGGVLWLLTATAGGPGATALGPLTSISAMALAWVVGFLAPGASAGIGVREAVLTLALSDVLGAQTSAVVALALRLVTTAGDGIFFGLALALPLPARPDPTRALATDKV
jgi:hypothetical protein